MKVLLLFFPRRAASVANYIRAALSGNGYCPDCGSIAYSVGEGGAYVIGVLGKGLGVHMRCDRCGWPH